MVEKFPSTACCSTEPLIVERRVGIWSLEFGFWDLEFVSAALRKSSTRKIPSLAPSRIVTIFAPHGLAATSRTSHRRHGGGVARVGARAAAEVSVRVQVRLRLQRVGGHWEPVHDCLSCAQRRTAARVREVEMNPNLRARKAWDSFAPQPHQMFET